MTIHLAEFVTLLTQNVYLLVVTILTLGVVLVNGWTDAPNAIATCIGTRSMQPRSAIIMAAIFNFLGVLVMTLINSTVAQTIYRMVDFGTDAHSAIIALSAAMIAIVIWATAASFFGIPTSESHALIAGLSGAAISIHSSLSGINGSEWIKVIYGLILSSILGYGLGYLTFKLIAFLFRGIDRRKTQGFFRKAQVFGSASMAFMHGAQDGQKFISVFLLGAFLAQGKSNVNEFVIPVWLMILCSLVMSLGTSIGGYRIIKAVGMDMVKLEPYQGFAADTAASACLLVSSLLSLPVSTTHTKTTAIMGVGAGKRVSAVNWGVVKDMVMAWVLTFPGCGIIGYFMAKIFIAIF
jgi:PiT family inorganic phosphate transporter